MHRGKNMAALPLALALAFALPPASPDEMKRQAFEVVERNADQMALIGDSLCLNAPVQFR